MQLSDMILIPVYVFIALFIIKILHLDVWIGWFLKIFKIPNHLESGIAELEERLNKPDAYN
jgi:hypothetical protein